MYICIHHDDKATQPSQEKPEINLQERDNTETVSIFLSFNF